MPVLHLRASVVLAACLAVIAACGAPADDPASRARRVEERVLAPCCRRQNLADHESEIAHALRGEIEQRTRAGETAAAIEDDLARRYGEDIRALPRDWDPRPMLGGIVTVIVALGAIVMLRFMRRRRRDPAPTTAAPPTALDETYEDRLDDELLAVE